MGANVNKVFLLGNVTRDPELRYTPSGAAVTTLGIAINRYFTSKEGDRREEVTFVDVTVWNRMAENCAQYLKRGRSVHVEGYLRLDTWDDKTTGQKRSQLKVEAENVQFLGSPRDDGGGGGSSYSPDDEPQSAPAPRRQAPPANGSPRGSGSSGPSSRRVTPEPENDEDIPF